MKTTSHFRIIIVMVTMIAVACSEPEVVPNVTPKPVGTPVVQYVAPIEYKTSVTTWTTGQNEFVGIVTQTPATDLANVDVYVVKGGQRIAIDRQKDPTNVNTYTATYGEYFWASYKNNVLLLHYIGASAPPFPLEVIIVY